MYICVCVCVCVCVYVCVWCLQVCVGLHLSNTPFFFIYLSLLSCFCLSFLPLPFQKDRPVTEWRNLV